MSEYNFNAKKEIENILDHMKNYFEECHLPKKCIVGISGGKDSYVVAALAVKLFGKENVIGIQLPNGVQADISDSDKIIENLGIAKKKVNISKAYKGLCKEIKKAAKTDANENYLFKTNTPSRIRMTTLYGLAALENAVVLNTDNLSEGLTGYSTLYGDLAGSYSPIKNYTVTEVRAIGDELGLLKEFVHKAPSDGMCGSTDEQSIARQTGVKDFTYEKLDILCRTGVSPFSEEDTEKLRERYRKNKFKFELINIPGFEPNLPNFIEY